MQLAQDVTTEPITRQEALRRWMRRTSTTFVGLAKNSGVTSAQMSKLCGQGTMPVRHHNHLVKQGVPTALLPRPEDHKCGRRPRPAHITDAEAMSAFRGG